MRYVLNLAYLSLLIVLSPWLVYAAFARGKYREGYSQKLLGMVPRRAKGDRKCIWMHAVSVGEVNLLQPLIDQLPQAFPDWECCISTTTKTGYDLATSKYGDFNVFYCPLDFSWSTAAAMRRVRPDILLLAELELWPNLISTARRHGARIAIVNGRLSEQSGRGYGRIRWFVKRLLRQLDLIAVQNADYAQRFTQLGANPNSVSVTGSIKFDGAETDRTNMKTRKLAKLASIQEQDIVFLAGSTQHPEEKLALDAFTRLILKYPALRLVLIPRHPNRFDEVARLLDASGVPWQRRSELSEPVPNRAASVDQEQRVDARILLVDTVGELGAWWGTARIAFVGGSMGSRGGQNMIEPAAYGAAVSFGPHTKNFRDVVKMLRTGLAAEVVHDGEQLEAFVERCLEDPDWATRLGRNAQQLVREQLGATRRTLTLLAGLMREPCSENPSGEFLPQPAAWHAGGRTQDAAEMPVGRAHRSKSA